MQLVFAPIGFMLLRRKCAGGIFSALLLEITPIIEYGFGTEVLGTESPTHSTMG
jgi:hypothetical protein